VVLGVAALVGVLGLASYLPVSGWASRWGATATEAAATMPGDDLIPATGSQSTRAVTITVPAAEVWPWLVQFGAGRGGLYSYDAAERMVGADIRNADRILPEHQHIAVGDTIWVTPEGYPANLVFKVADVQPQQALVIAATDDPRSRAVPEDHGWTWTFHLVDIDGQTTRLISRNRQTAAGPIASALSKTIVDPIGFVMERKTLVGIKARAEGTVSNDVVFFALLAVAGLLVVGLAATPRFPRGGRFLTAVLGAGALGLVLFIGYPTPWWSLLIVGAVAGVAVWLWPRTGRSPHRDGWSGVNRRRLAAASRRAS
jgi:hypothetical protein